MSADDDTKNDKSVTITALDTNVSVSGLKTGLNVMMSFFKKTDRELY